MWIYCKDKIPNDDEISYDGIGWDGKRKVSDRVLAIDADGYIRIGYFMNSCAKPRYGKRFEFGDHYDNNPQNWIVGHADWTPIAWMPLPEPPRN